MEKGEDLLQQLQVPGWGGTLECEEALPTLLCDSWPSPPSLGLWAVRVSDDTSLQPAVGLHTRKEARLQAEVPSCSGW